MDIDTAVILVLLSTALTCWLTMLISESRQEIKKSRQMELERINRALRVKKLMNKM